MGIKQGWTGRVYEDFEIGDIYVHPLGRTVLPVDNSWFTLLTQNMNPIHFDAEYSSHTEFKRHHIGHGIGLHEAHRLAADLGGSLTVNGSPGHGTSVTLTLCGATTTLSGESRGA